MAKVKIKTLTDLACRLGVIEDTPASRQSYTGWLSRDPDAAQRPLVAAMSGSSPTPVARPVPAGDYPTVWASGMASVRPAGVQTSKGARPSDAPSTGVPITPYPAAWLPTGLRAQAVAEYGSTPVKQGVHALQDTPSLLASLAAGQAQALTVVQAGAGVINAAAAAPNDNARRLAAMRDADYARMRREQARLAS